MKTDGKAKRPHLPTPVLKYELNRFLFSECKNPNPNLRDSGTRLCSVSCSFGLEPLLLQHPTLRGREEAAVAQTAGGVRLPVEQHSGCGGGQEPDP